MLKTFSIVFLGRCSKYGLVNGLITPGYTSNRFRKEKISVRFMEHDRSETNETKTIDRKVEAIIRHLRYNPGTYDNDIALLKLDKRVSKLDVENFKALLIFQL